MTSTADTTLVELDSPGEVLRFARDRRAAADRAEADVLHAAVTWAEQHPPESIDEAATWFAPGVGDTGLTLAGEGAPLVAEFCIAELALALGISTDAGRSLVADSVELKYRLTRTWARTTKSGDLPAWRARRIAQATNGLTAEAAAYVDAQVAPFAHKIGFAALERLVAEAIARFMPHRALADAQRAADGRCFDIHHDQVSFNGTSRIEGELDLADALDLDAAIAREAEAIKALGSTESLDVRRSQAAGQIARHQLALDLNAAATGTAITGDPAGAPARTDRAVKPRQVVLYVHLSDAAITGVGAGTGSGAGGTGAGGCFDLARVENRRQVVTADRVRGWCANPETEVVVHPVVDLADRIAVEGYEVPDRLREQTTLRDRVCVFPWCTRSARRSDADHVIPYDQSGATASDNIAPLCRRHHRLKTHTAWTYTMLEPGSYLWSSPHGYQFLRDTEGTLDVSHDRRPPDPRPPDQ